MTRAVGVDIGGTKTAVAVCDGRAVVERVQFATPDDPDHLVHQVTRAVGRLRRTQEASGHQVSGVGVGVAGFVAPDRSTVLVAPNLPQLRPSLGQELSDALRLGVVVENDANAAAWGEYRFGAGQGIADQLLVTVGTGIGGGLVLDGQLYRGGHGLAAEIGHLQVVEGGRSCGCGQQGCWETYASGTALAVLTRGRPASASPAALEELGHWLGVGLAGLCAVLDPSLVLIGGGVAAAGAPYVDAARASFAARLPGGRHRPVPEIRCAALGVDAGVVGAAALADDRVRGR